MVASPALVVGMQDNEYTDAQVGDAGGLFKSLDPAPCGAGPAYLIQCSSSSLPHPVLQIQSTSSSAPVPVFLIQCSGSSLPSSSASDPVYLIQCSGSMQSASSSAPVPVYLIQSPIPVYLIQCSNSSLPHQKTISCSLFLFFSCFYLNNNYYNFFMQ